MKRLAKMDEKFRLLPYFSAILLPLLSWHFLTLSKMKLNGMLSLPLIFCSFFKNE
jgi:hypothetical protein